MQVLEQCREQLPVAALVFSRRGFSLSRVNTETKFCICSGTDINLVSLKANLQNPIQYSTCNTVLVGEALPAWMQVLEQCREQLPVAALVFSRRGFSLSRVNTETKCSSFSFVIA